MVKQRDSAIDYMKCIAIFAVVLGHVLERTCNSENPLRLFIYSFHMPLFFMASGFLGGEKVNDFKIIFNKFLQKTRLLIPLFVIGMAYTVYSGKSIIEDFLFASGKNGYWFLLALFFIFTIYYAVSIITIKLKSIILVGFILLIPYFFILLTKSYVDTEIGRLLGLGFLSNYLYFIVGVFIRRSKRLQIALDRDIIQLVFLIIYISLFVNRMSVFSPIMKCSAILFVWGMVHKFGQNFASLNRYVSYLGSRTLDIYVIHYFFILGLSASPIKTMLYPLYCSPALYIPITFFISGFVCMIVLLISGIIRSNKYMRTFLLGLK